jgi:hypothetical protein
MDRATYAVVLADLEAAGEGAGYYAFVVRTFEASHQLAFGDASEAARLYQQLRQNGFRQRRGSLQLSRVLISLATALADEDQLDEARVILLEALPHVQSCGRWASYAPGIAYLAAKRGRLATAARLLGSGDKNLLYAPEGRGANQRRCYERTFAILESTHTEEQLAAWLAEGEALGEAEFMRLVLEKG